MSELIRENLFLKANIVEINEEAQRPNNFGGSEQTDFGPVLGNYGNIIRLKATKKTRS